MRPNLAQLVIIEISANQLFPSRHIFTAHRKIVLQGVRSYFNKRKQLDLTNPIGA